MNTDNGHRLKEWHRGRCRHHKTEWLSSVFRDALPDKDFYDRPLTHRLNSIHRKEQCRNDGTFRSASLRHTSFYRGCTDFFPVFQSIAATVGSATIYVFMGFHPGEPFQQNVPSTSGSVRVACLNLTCGEGIFFWLWHKKSPDLLRRLVFFMSRPEHPSFAPHAFQVSSNSYNHTVFGRMVKKKLPPI